MPDQLYYVDSNSRIHGPFASHEDMVSYTESHSSSNIGTTALLVGATVVGGAARGFGLGYLISGAILVLILIFCTMIDANKSDITPEQQIKHELAKQDIDKFVKEVTTSPVQTKIHHNNVVYKPKPVTDHYKPPKSQVNCSDFSGMPRLYTACVQSESKTIKTNH